LKRLHGGGLERESGAGWPKLRLALEDLALEASPSEGYSKSEATNAATGDEYLAAGLDCCVHATEFSVSGPNLRRVPRHANRESSTCLSTGTNRHLVGCESAASQPCCHESTAGQNQERRLRSFETRTAAIPMPTSVNEAGSGVGDAPKTSNEFTPPGAADDT
jgi:hypothetical protein